MQRGANPNIPRTDGRTFLIELVGYTPRTYQTSEIIGLLLRNNVDANVKDNLGKPALFYTIDWDDVLELFLESPMVDVDIQDRTGKTALMVACEGNFDEAVELLLSNGADPFMIDDLGQSTSQYAVSPEVDSLLIIWEDSYRKNFESSKIQLNKKLTAGRTLKPVLGQKYLPDRIVKESEYDRLCMIKALQRNNKTDLQALAASLKIPISNKSKTQLCQDITKSLKL